MNALVRFALRALPIVLAVVFLAPAAADPPLVSGLSVERGGTINLFDHVRTDKRMGLDPMG